MSKSWPKLIRDPVHDIISFENKPWDHLLLNLINTREFQRLRRIKQLGMSEMVFPGANHSRFAHAIGVMHNARLFLARIERLTEKAIDDSHRTAVLAAALLHDLGHGPFSHTFEKITGENHEKRTNEIIISEGTEVNTVLRAHDPNLPQTLRQFFDEDPEASGNSPLPKHYVQIVSSQLDADRFDYLLRDAHATGADYGRFDTRWIIQHLVLDESKNRLHLSNKAYIAAETYVFARYHMYRAVYFHKTTRAAEVMLKLMFRRYKALLEKAATPNKRAAIVPSAPPAVINAFTAAGAMPLNEYLKLDDHSVTEFLKGCLTAKDKVLAQLATGILDRKLFKAIDVTDADAGSIAEFVSACKDQLKSHPLAEASFVDDRPADTPYKPYDPDSDKPATQIYVENSMGQPQEFGTLSSAVQSLKSKYSLLRYYFPEDARATVESVAAKHLKKEK